MDIRKAADIFGRMMDGASTPEDIAESMIPPPAVDLSKIPREEWPKYDGHPLTLPPEIVRYIEGQSEFSQLESEALEDRVTAHFGITEPLFVVFEKGPPAELWLAVGK